MTDTKNLVTTLRIISDFSIHIFHITMISSGPVARVRSLYLQVLGLSYAVALHSLYVQLPGLYGDSGIMPASSVVTNIRSGH